MIYLFTEYVNILTCKYSLTKGLKPSSLKEGSGQVPEVLPYRVDPWKMWSKPRTLRLGAKLSLISLIPHGDRIRS